MCCLFFLTLDLETRGPFALFASQSVASEHFSLFREQFSAQERDFTQNCWFRMAQEWWRRPCPLLASLASLVQVTTAPGGDFSGSLHCLFTTHSRGWHPCQQKDRLNSETNRGSLLYCSHSSSVFPGPRGRDLDR